MSKKSYKYIYGPVSSWRLGSSLGIDPLSQGKKICTFDCIYCQIGKTDNLTDKRDVFVKVSDIVEEIDNLPPLEIDYMTFSGRGEPTLAKNLGQMIKALKKIRNGKIAVLTNSSLMDRKDVQDDLFAADLIVAKLDAPSQEVFGKINQPMKTIRLDSIIQAVTDFKRCFVGRLVLQIMFTQENKEYAEELARVASEIEPDEVQLNTPLRPCGVKPLKESEMDIIKEYFSGLSAISVYDAKKRNVRPISSEDTLRRRGKV